MMKNIFYIAVFVIIIGILFLWTRQRNEVYKSELSLWEDTVVKSPNKPRVLVNLSMAYKREHRDGEGILALQKAFEIQPDLIPYFRALIYVHEQGGVLITEKDVWNTPRERMLYGNMNPRLELK